MLAKVDAVPHRKRRSSTNVVILRRYITDSEWVPRIDRMLEFYPDIRLAHISVAILSGALFAFRGGFVQAGATWPMVAPLRYLSYAIDTIIVATALALLTVLPASVYANGWLALKLVLLVIYIVLGSVALKRGRTRRGRLIAFGTAILTYLAMLSVARTHHPLGPWFVVRDWLI